DRSRAIVYSGNQDISATGHPLIAVLVGSTKRLCHRTVRPTAIVSFSWNNASDSDNDPLTYRHCIWGVDEMFTFNKCNVVSSQTPSWDVVLKPNQAYFWKTITNCNAEKR